MRTRTGSLARRLGAAALAASLAACVADAPPVAPIDAPAPSLARGSALEIEGSGQSGLAAIRAATARYHRVEVAIADGYASTVACAASPDGAMGVHYVKEALLGPPVPGGDATIDPLRPEVLVYEPMRNGRFRLVAVEYLVWRAAWDAANPGDGPSLLGVPFVESFGVKAHGLPDHYELHVWLWRHNPAGMFAQWNPDVSCP